MTHTVFGGAATMKVSSWCFRVTGTLLMIMVPIFLVGRLTQLSQQAANAALGALGIGVAVAVMVGTIALIWRK